MDRRIFAGAAMIGALALAGCGGSSEPEARQGVLAVGSSTVYPFARAVGEALAKADAELAPVTVESVGTTEGIAQFCAGAGPDTPDIADASRRMTKAEFDGCQANGVTGIVELQVGLDGIVFASSQDGGLEMNLTPRIIYLALAAQPFGNEQTAMNWSDVDPSLPDEAITVYGPPESSGTRDALIELAMKPGCKTNAGMGMLAPDKFEETCGTLRSDSAYMAQGEQDDVIVRKVAGNKRALAVFGWSYAEENAGEVKALPISGIEPSAETITTGSYPLSRPLYIYVKTAHLDTIPGLKPYVAQWAANWGQDGPLSAIGLVPSHDEDRAANADIAAKMTPMTGEGLE